MIAQHDIVTYKYTPTHHIHSTCELFLSFSSPSFGLSLSCFVDSSTLTPPQTNVNRSRNLYFQDLHQGSPHTELLFLWSHGRMRSSTAHPLFRFTCHNRPTSRTFQLKFIHSNFQQHSHHTSTLNCYSLGSLGLVVQSHLTHAITYASHDEFSIDTSHCLPDTFSE